MVEPRMLLWDGQLLLARLSRLLLHWNRSTRVTSSGSGVGVYLTFLFCFVSDVELLTSAIYYL